MLVVYKDVVVIQVFHDLTEDDVFHNFTYQDMRKQVDMMILDFSKAFHTVPHRRLLMKLDHYEIRDHTHEWIRQWLTTRKQRVVLYNCVVSIV
jgi:hypothetical protein